MGCKFRGNVGGRLCAVALSTLVLGACATVPRVPANADDAMPASAWPVVLAPGDVVDVKFLYWPDLNETQTIRGDGKISLQLIGDAEAAGLTTEELRKQLVELYKGELRDPEIAVISRKERNAFIYVMGAVPEPGRVPYAVSMTPLEAVASAGGPLASARLSDVLVIRRIEDTAYGRTLDLRAAFHEKERPAFALEPNDVLFVPKSNIGRAGDWVDLHVNHLVPDSISLLGVLGGGGDEHTSHVVAGSGPISVNVDH